MRKPKMAVVIGTFNRPDELLKTAEHFANQTLSDVEFVITDNGVNPKTVAAVNEIIAGDDRFRYVNSAKNGKGVTVNRNTGIAAVSAEAEFIHMTDDDDYPESKGYLKSLYKRMKKGNDKKGRDTLFAYTPHLIKKGGETRSVYSNIEDIHEIGRSLRKENGVTRSPNLPAKGMLFNAAFLKKYPLSHEYRDTAEDYGLFVDTLLRLKKMRLYPQFTDDVAGQYFLDDSPNKLIAANRMKNPYYKASRNRVQKKYLQWLGHDS